MYHEIISFLLPFLSNLYTEWRTRPKVEPFGTPLIMTWKGDLNSSSLTKVIQTDEGFAQVMKQLDNTYILSSRVKEHLSNSIKLSSSCFRLITLSLTRTGLRLSTSSISLSGMLLLVPRNSLVEKDLCICEPWRFLVFYGAAILHAPATFQHLVNTASSGLSGREANLDNIVVNSASWADLIQQVHEGI